MSNLGLIEYLRKVHGLPQVEFEIETPEGDKVTIWLGRVHEEDIASAYRRLKRLFADVEV